MKRIGIFFLLLVMIIHCCGCAKRTIDTSPEFNPDTDYNTNYDQFGYGSQFVETDDGYYYLTSARFLRFIDKKTMKDIALCNKPECSHELGDEDICNAYLGVMAPAELYYYKGKLYGFTDRSSAEEIGDSGKYLCEISKDGSWTKNVWELKWKSGSRGALRKEVCLSYIRLSASDIASQ